MAAKLKFPTKHMHSHLVPCFSRNGITWRPWILLSVDLRRPRVGRWTGLTRYAPWNRRLVPL